MLNKLGFSTHKLLILGVVLILNSCKNELDVVAPGDPVPIVYGILNPNDSIQFIRITKAFVDKNRSAFQIAKDIDAQYFPDNIQVILSEINNGKVVKQFTLDTFSIPKEEGIFGGPNNLLYQTREPILKTKTVKYELSIVAKESKKTICSAITLSVGDFKVFPPLLPDSNELPVIKFVSGASFNNPVINWNNGLNISKYDAYLNFYFDELDTITKSKISRKLSWKFGSMITSQGGNGASKKIESEKFFEFIANALSPKTNTIRTPKFQMDIEVFGAGIDLANYIELNAPSYFISDLKPVYTNINNGFGLFSSRTSSVLKFETDLKSMQYLNKNPKTTKLGFIVPE